MNSRKLAGASAASVGAATAVVALLLGTVSGNAGEGDPRASAFGIAAKGLIPISPTPYVEAPPDGSKALLELPSPIGVALLKVEAEAFRSQATAVDVDILGIKAELIQARCDRGKGDASLIGGIGGTGKDKPLPSSPATGQALDLSPILKVEFNRQKKDRDKLTVDALVVSLLPSDNAAKAVQEKDLTDLKGLAPNLEVPTMEQLKAERTKSAPQQQSLQQQSPQQQQQQSPQQQSPPQQSPPQQQQQSPPPQQQQSPQQQASPAPTVADLVSQLKTLNPNLVPKGDGDALLEIVISSASCNDDRKKEDKDEAPKPKPVEADLPVTH